MSNAEDFVKALNGQPAPVYIDSERDPPDTIYSGGIETIHSRCDGIDFDESDDYTTPNPDGSCGTYFFRDGTKAGLKWQDSKWQAWVMQ
jgi:hypothetical protein